jgi:predicted kinase
VVADAVFDRPDERRRIAQAAGASPFLGLWLEVAPERLVRRVAERRGDVSDATPAVVEAQLERFQGPTGWTRVAADGDASAVCATAARIVAGSKAGA